MMFKAMVLLKRKPGLTLQQFIDHYENNHAPLGVKYQTRMVRYIRHYLHPSPYPLDGTIVEAEYDVLTELWFEDKAAYDEGMALMMAPEANAVLNEDEARFLDLTKSRLAYIEEHESEIPGQVGVRDNRKDIRSLVLLQRKPGMTMDEFIDHYETVHAHLGVKHSETLARYRRFFLRPAPYPLDGTVVEPAYDVATEVSFASKEDRDHATANMMKPEVNAIIEADESTFIHKPTRRFMGLESHESVLPWVDPSRFTTW